MESLSNHLEPIAEFEDVQVELPMSKSAQKPHGMLSHVSLKSAMKQGGLGMKALAPEKPYESASSLARLKSVQNKKLKAASNKRKGSLESV